jgi:hypothetical protein
MHAFHDLLFQGMGAALAALQEGQVLENDHHRSVHPEGEIA